MTPQPHGQDGYPRKWWILIAVGLTLFMGTIDGTIVNVALPTLTRELSTDFPTMQWVVLSFSAGAHHVHAQHGAAGRYGRQETGRSAPG